MKKKRATDSNWRNTILTSFVLIFQDDCIKHKSYTFPMFVAIIAVQRVSFCLCEQPGKLKKKKNDEVVNSSERITNPVDWKRSNGKWIFGIKGAVLSKGWIGVVARKHVSFVRQRVRVARFGWLLSFLSSPLAYLISTKRHSLLRTCVTNEPSAYKPPPPTAVSLIHKTYPTFAFAHSTHSPDVRLRTYNACVSACTS